MAEKVPVKKGDTLSTIAAAKGTTVAQILADNPVLKARADAGQTVLYSGTKVLITEPNTATNPYGPTTSGAGAGLGTGAVPIGPTSGVDTTTLEGILAASGTTLDPSGKIIDNPNTGTYNPITKSFDPIEPPVKKDEPPAGGRKVTSQYYSGSGANRILVIQYDDGTTDQVPAPETTAGMSAEDVNRLIQEAINGQNQKFQEMLAAQQKALEVAKAEQVAAQRKSAFDVIRERFTQMGIKEVGDDIAAIFAGKGKDRFGKAFDEIPTTSEGFYLQLINTKSYYDRFGSVNEARLNAGYKALDEKTIVGMEDEYQKVLTSYNMPAGFYDQTVDFQSFLKNNLTNVDVANIIQAYRDFVTTGTDSNVRKQLKDLYGINDEALTAYMIDPTKGQGILEQIAGKNMNTAAALIEGLTAEQAQMAQAYGAGSLNYGTQRQKYSQVQQELQTTGNLAAIYGENFGAKEAIAAEFGGDVQAQAQAARIKATGQAVFGGTSGLGSKALRVKTI
jgi:hypothetical protein